MPAPVAARAGVSSRMSIETPEEKAKQRVRQLIWLYFWLLLIEGALRKWVVPQLSNPLLLVRGGCCRSVGCSWVSSGMCTPIGRRSHARQPMTASGWTRPSPRPCLHKEPTVPDSEGSDDDDGNDDDGDDDD